MSRTSRPLGPVLAPRRGHTRDHDPGAGPPARHVRPPRPRPPALAATAAIALGCTAGGAVLVAQISGSARVFPGEMVLALVLAAATLTFGFWLLRRIRPVRAPDPVVCAVAALWGLTAATGAGVIANSALHGVWATVLGVGPATAWGAALTAPLNEEALKLAGVVLVAIAFPRALRGPADGYILGAIVGLGFEVTENLIYALGAIVQSGATAGALSVVQSAVLRVGLTGLGSHWAMTAVAGTAIGLLVPLRHRPAPRRAAAAAALVLLAMALHWLLDAPLFGNTVPAVLAKVLVIFTATMLVYLTARRDHRRRVRAALAAQGAAAGVPPSAALALATRGGRRRERRRSAPGDLDLVRERQRQMLDDAEDSAAHRDPA
ncbi:RsiW-degrading membrane proteinase PrsW (M82 family) [Nocardiopsis sp. Huas11]|uniref:PrsW family glutamic-type intramembrane protease n=1 Tax=Nocardiopsis sp. Huas11 TaxID=2183912 RepID=UPI000F1D9393|nr:PrsW family glutamic-type intramembrane protease [Nocardiopsis sp. Huas11]RKS09687.1 RsiW-degrading membrane proteinase PrsW (M82 family) [Nocardiopsis sp. Huas11]